MTYILILIILLFEIRQNKVWNLQNIFNNGHFYLRISVRMILDNLDILNKFIFKSVMSEKCEN